MMINHGIKHGDLVFVDGYGTRPFFVDSWVVEEYHTPDGVWTEVWFDITCAYTGEYNMAELSDIKHVCSAEKADEFLQDQAKKVIKAEVVTKPEPKPKVSNVDRLLDELRDYLALYETFGDEEYKHKVDEIKAELEAITGVRGEE